jgi:hypothetical protein
VLDSHGERPLGLRNGVVLRGTAIGTKASAGDADVYKHANGLPSRLARIVSDRRGPEEQSRRDHEAQASTGPSLPKGRGGLPSLRSSDLRVSHVSWPHLKGVGHEGEGSRAFGVRVSSPGVGEVA